MEWVTYFMIILMVFPTCFGWPVIIDFEDSDGSAGTIGSGSGGGFPSSQDPPYPDKEKDGPAGGAGPDSTNA